MELTYKLMLYGGLTGALITLPIAIWLFIKLDILDVLQDLTGLQLRKYKRNQNSATFQTWYKQEHTSSSIQLKKLNNTNGSQSVQVHPIRTDAETELLEEDELFQQQLSHEDNETELLAATTFLDNETELLGEEKHAFIMEEDIVIGHNLPKHKEGKK